MIATRVRRILVLTGPFPSHVQPTSGIFVKERIRALADMRGYDVRVVSPVPYFPPIKFFSQWYIWSQFPQREVVEGLSVLRPRYFIPPKLGHYFEPFMMYHAALAAVRHLQDDNWDFDIIDAHWAHPAGVAAILLGKRFGKPVVVTGRGEDLCQHVHRPIVGPQIRWALRNASHCIAVSREISDLMKSNGAALDGVTVIPNGVNTQMFRPLDQDTARVRLGLPSNARIILSVGDCFENKGFHLLIDALPGICRRHPHAMLVVVGGAPRTGADFTLELRRRIDQHGLSKRVLLTGRQPHEELLWWYNAADVFALFSAREGCPNVLLEALACGRPAVATAVGGIPDVLCDERLGILASDRSTVAAEQTLVEALDRDWNRDGIRKLVESKNWSETATQVSAVIECACCAE